MKAAVYYGKEDIRIEDVEKPNYGPDDLFIEVRVVGICGTDAHEFSTGPHMFPIHEAHSVSGHLGPMIPGHELTGIVREVGSNVTDFSPGDLVVSGAGISCGECIQCERRRTNLCERYSTIGLQQNGALAEYVVVPADICLNVEEYGITQDVAALAQPMSIAVHAMRRGRLTSEDQAVLIGAGGIGAFLTYAVANTAKDLAVIDLDQGRLDIAKGLGAPRLLKLDRGEDAAQQIDEWGMNPTVVYEVSGTRSGLQTALSILPRGGRLVLVGLQGQPVEWDVRTLSLIEHEVIGTNAHVFATDMPYALELLAGRKDTWSDIAPVALSLEDLVREGLEPIVQGRSPRIKTLIDPWAAETRPTIMSN